MMKRFLTSMLGTLAGIWISVIIVIIALIFIAGAIFSNVLNNGKIEMTDNTILYIDLSGKIEERYTPVDIKQSLVGYNIETIALNDIINAIELATTDRKIKGIYLDCNGATAGVATIHEIIAAIEKFKKESGKWVYAYADQYNQGNYYIACAADEIILNPSGLVDVYGLSATTMFYKGLMDKVGIEVQVVKVGSYKSAIEPYTRIDMSAESREQQEYYMGNIWKSVSTEIAEKRGVSEADVNNWADSLLFFQEQQTYVDKKIVDRLCYRHEVEDMLRKLTNKKKDDCLTLVSPKDYCMAKDQRFAGGRDKNNIAVLYAVGEIVDFGKGGIVGDEIVPLILKLAKQEDVKGLILRVNSGGGSAYASEQIWEALEQFKATGKPFYVSMGDVAASGGYYISCGGDRIYAEAQTLTGSIGIFGIIPNVKPLLNDKLGITTNTVKTNLNGSFPAIVEPMTVMQQQNLQQYVENGYEQFVSRCASGRDISVDSIKEIAEGRVWDGTTALKLGLVDMIGDMSTAIADMAGELNLSKYSVKEYPIINESLFQQLLLSEDMDVEALYGSEFKELCKYMETLKTIRNMSPVQCRMEEVVIH